MASSSEAFEKFEMWKNSKTPLKVTVFEGGKNTGVLVGLVIVLDSDAEQVGISNRLVMHSFAPFDVEGAEFSIEPSRMVVTRNESDWLVFEVVDELTRIWSRPVR